MKSPILSIEELISLSQTPAQLVYPQPPIQSLPIQGLPNTPYIQGLEPQPFIQGLPLIQREPLEPQPFIQGLPNTPFIQGLEPQPFIQGLPLIQREPHIQGLAQPFIQGLPLINHIQQFIDVHTFDYSYKEYDLTIDMTRDEKEDWIRQLIPKMKRPIAIQGVHMILANIGNQANMDQTNQKTAEDILVKLTQHVIQCDESFTELIEEQLEDMVQLGQCAQGRTTRLWQLYCSLPKNEKL